jgi:hypothetical protein
MLRVQARRKFLLRCSCPTSWVLAPKSLASLHQVRHTFSSILRNTVDAAMPSPGDNRLRLSAVPFCYMS